VALNLRNVETEKLVRELAQRRGTSLTEAVHEAVREELRRENEKPSLWDKTQGIRAFFAKFPETGLAADKAFYDDLSSQGDDDGERAR
jgi:antitoxin VapB